jgi:queuosine precursor transporter
MATDMQVRVIGFLAFAMFLWSIPASNWMIGNVGTVCVPEGPCLLPVAPGLLAPSGVVLVGFALVLRDVIQRCLGIVPSFIAILGGAMVSVVIAPQQLVVASAAAFLLSELADLAVYTPLQSRGLVLAVVASAAVGLVVDSAVFLFMAFHSLSFLAGQVVGKAWGVLASVPVIQLLRRLVPTPLP